MMQTNEGKSNEDFTELAWRLQWKIIFHLKSYELSSLTDQYHCFDTGFHILFNDTTTKSVI